VWGVIPDFWSISGSGLILGGAIWVAVAKSRIKHDHHDDLERNDYVRVDGEEQVGKPAEDFELGEMSDDENGLHPSSSSSSSHPMNSVIHDDGEGSDKGHVDREREDLNVAGDGELTEVVNWGDSARV
jgi:hypothetical protein